MERDWKKQYLEVLDQQEQQRVRYGRKTSLLARGLHLTSQLAAGGDEQTDRSLTGLRGLLRKESLPNADLESAVVAMERQLKPALQRREETTKAIVACLQAMTETLRSVQDDKLTDKQAKVVQRQLKQLDIYYNELPQILEGVSGLQASVLDLARADQQQDPAGSAPAAKPLWSRLFGSAEPAAPASGDTATASGADQPAPADWKLEPTVRLTLERLLQRVTPTEAVMSHYKAAKALINHDLNGYELAPALEHLSEVMLASIQHDQDEFQHFLTQLNLRLQEAFNQLTLSLELTGAESDAASLLNRTMLAHVSAFQTSVAAATDIDTLKSSVSNNLEQIVQTIDAHTREGEQRQQKLGEELASMAERIKTMEASSQQAAEMLDEQRRLAMLDALTQLPNRAAYNQRATEELSRWQRHQGSLTLAVCDVDWFKKVNDTYGHAAGDRVLQVLGATLRKSLRKSDFVARFGGEEFVVLMPETDAEQAVDVLNKVREIVAGEPVAWEEQSIAISISCGISVFKGQDNLESVFARADRALYDAKNAGRNCCRVILEAAAPSAAP